MLAINLLLAIAATANPLPYPLPANISFGRCGDIPAGVTVPGCSASVTLAAKVAVRCATAAGCDSGCASSSLAQGVFARYEARLSGGGAPPPPPMVQPIVSTDPAAAAKGQRFWWRLNDTNCNLHDLHSVRCHSIDDCKTKCEASPSCGAFLMYTKNSPPTFAAKNATCWSDIGPLPPSDDGDDLFIMRDIPEPPPLPAAGGELSAVEVCLTGASEELGPDTDESYALSVPASAGGADAAAVRAATIFGAMHALESLTQLVEVRVGAGEPTTIPSAPVEIHDKPRFPFRGLMIDSGRHFLPLSHVKKTVIAASMAKLNVIHWHLVDAQSFATCSEQFPALCDKGAYPNTEGPPSRNVSKATYTPAELRELVAFAKSYGVRIMPEWDMPGHGSWGK